MKSILIIGLGRFGRHLCCKFMGLKNEVMIVDRDEAAVTALADEATSAQIADCTDENALRALGVTDVFDAGKADFSPLTDKADSIFLSQAKHSARVTIDEEGVVAAAYTVMVACGAALPPDERVEFTLDRPFLFAVTGESGEILFAGIVNTPA